MSLCKVFCGASRCSNAVDGSVHYLSASVLTPAVPANTVADSPVLPVDLMSWFPLDICWQLPALVIKVMYLRPRIRH